MQPETQSIGSGSGFTGPTARSAEKDNTNESEQMSSEKLLTTEKVQ